VAQAAFLSLRVGLGSDDSPADDPGVLGQRSRGVMKWLTSQGYEIRTCALDSGDYLANDRHPNRRGHDKIAACAAGALEALNARSRSP
jgi:hypothetical protein